MSDETGAIRTVAWGEVFPWLMIFRAVRLSISMPVLLLATVATILMSLGSWGAQYLVPRQVESPSLARHVADAQLPDLIGSTRSQVPTPTLTVPSRFGELAAPMASAVATLLAPLRQMLRLELPWSELLYYVLVGLWNLVVWGFFGGAITRMAVMRLGREEREGLFDACRFVRRRWLGFVGAPLFALAGVVLVAAPTGLVGLLMRWDIGMLLAAVLGSWCWWLA